MPFELTHISSPDNNEAEEAWPVSRDLNKADGGFRTGAWSLGQPCLQLPVYSLGSEAPRTTGCISGLHVSKQK